MIQRIATYRSILLLAVLLPALQLFSQDLSKKISIRSNNQPLGEVLSTISQKSGIYFSYSPQLVPVDKKVSINARNETVSSVLDELLKPLQLSYQFTENQLIIKPSPVEENRDFPNVNKRKFTFSGYVKDASSGEILIGANVYDKVSFNGTTTNNYGYFSLTLPEGSYKMIISLLGYQQLEKTIDLQAAIRENIELQPGLIDIGEVEIVGNQEEVTLLKENNSNFRMSGALLKQMPGFAGNIDVIKSLQTVPGINSFGDGSAFYYVRGGNNDQNLLLIDEAPIYNPSHLFGFFSALAPDAIKDVKAYKGDFPASYGGRLSSVIDVRARDGNMKRIGFSGNIGPFTTDLTIEGPIRKEKSSFIVSARKSNLNWLNFSSKADRTFSMNFYDLNGKLNIRINDNNRIFLTVFNGNDEFSRYTTSSVNTFGIQWKNSTGTLRWNHIFNSRLFANTTVCASRYDYFLFISRELNDYWTSAISNGTIKTDFSWFASPKHTVKSGLELSRHFSNPGNIVSSDAEVEGRKPVIPQYYSLEGVFYATDDYLIANDISLNYGMRLSLWRDMGPTSVYLFDGTHQVIDTAVVASNTIYQDYFNPEPRISLSYTLSPSAVFRVSYNRTVQYLQMLSNSTSPFTSLEVWAPSGPNIKPQKADQYSIGFTQYLKHGLHLSLEGFYKKLYNQLEYKDHANMLYNPLIEGELRFGEAEAKGFEFMLKKPEGKFTYWLAYSWSTVNRTAADINEGKTYPASYDRPHKININLSYKSGKHWEYSANWIYLSGAPISTPTGFFEYNGYVVPFYGEKNNDRLPAYHRLDISVSCHLSKPGNRYQHSLVLSAYNLYGRNNPFSINFNKIMDDNGKFLVPSDLSGNYEIIPTAMSVAGVIPSLNYTFRF